MIEISIDGERFECPPGTTVAAAILNAGIEGFRTSITDSARGPLCGMGVCFECRVTINGMPHQRSCTALVERGMEIKTGAEEKLATDGHRYEER